MTAGDSDFDELLRSALHSAADPIEPTGDGLTRIQERITKPWLRRRMSLLVTEFVDLAWLVIIRCEPALGWARTKLTAASAALPVLLRRLSAPALDLAAPVVDRVRRRALLRSLVAVAAVTTLVVGVAYGLGLNPMRTTITGIGQITGGAGGGHGSNGNADSAGSSRVPPQHGHGRSRHHPGSRSGDHRHSRPGPGQSSCQPTPSPQGSGTPSPTASPTDSPTPSGSPTPTPTPTDTPTPTPTVSAQVSPNPFAFSNAAFACPSTAPPVVPPSTPSTPGQTGATGNTGTSTAP